MRPKRQPATPPASTTPSTSTTEDRVAGRALYGKEMVALRAGMAVPSRGPVHDATVAAFIRDLPPRAAARPGFQLPDEDAIP